MRAYPEVTLWYIAVGIVIFDLFCVSISVWASSNDYEP